MQKAIIDDLEYNRKFAISSVMEKFDLTEKESKALIWEYLITEKGLTGLFEDIRNQLKRGENNDTR
jgi:hypothetical protein